MQPLSVPTEGNHSLQLRKNGAESRPHSGTNDRKSCLVKNITNHPGLLPPQAGRVSTGPMRGRWPCRRLSTMIAAGNRVGRASAN